MIGRCRPHRRIDGCNIDRRKVNTLESSFVFSVLDLHPIQDAAYISLDYGWLFSRRSRNTVMIIKKSSKQTRGHT